MTKDGVVESTCDEIVYQGMMRRAWLVFTSGIKHSKMVQDALTARGIDCAVILGTTDDATRKREIEKFRRGELRCLISVNVLSVGFNVPHVDLIALTRPTKSPGMYYQQVGRGLRLAHGKENCIILDFASNIATHGNIDTLNDRVSAKRKSDEPGEAPVKECPNCHTYCFTAERRCHYCGHEFPPVAIVKHAGLADVNSPLSTELVISVSHMKLFDWPSKFPNKPNTLLIKYFCQMKQVACEWLAVHRSSVQYARNKSYQVLIPMLKPGYTDITDGILQLTNGQGRSVSIDTPLDAVKVQHCFQSPAGIVVNPPSQGSKYPTVVRRIYSESHEPSHADAGNRRYDATS
jgi:DNA repair protein RadD